MRYLKFENIFIDTDNQLLIRDGESINLAPKVYDLLIYFCLNHHKIISKDELMDHVWTGTIVTENAISRTLVKVRKALADDPKNPNFIITVPRKGYRMVATFVKVENTEVDCIELDVIEEDVIGGINSEVENPENASVESEYIDTTASEKRPLLEKHLDQIQAENPLSAFKEDSRTFIIKVVISAFILLIISVFLFPIDFQQAETITTKQLKSLTRESAQEQHPTISPDLTHLAYSKTVAGQRSYITIENLAVHKKINITHARAKLSRPVWSPTIDKLAFLYQHNTVCMIYWADVTDIQNKDSWQEISECSKDSWPHFVFSPDGEYLYFNDRQSQTNGYQIFRVNLANHQKDIVNQPITSGQGNYAFDISPDGERLVMLNSEFAPYTRIYTLDIAESALNQTAQLPYLMRSVSWHHDNQTLVHPSPHPAYELWQSNLSGQKLAVVASNTSRVKQLSRINNGKDFTFVSYLINRDIHYRDKKSGTNISTDNSSVMDYLPALANTSDSYAFVSKRTSTAEVYLSSLSDRESRQISFFENRVKLYDLSFSPTDKQLAILADNQIFILTLDGLVLKALPLNNIAISGLSWQDEDTLLFSTVENNDWSFMQYKISTGQLSKMPIGYQGGLYSKLDGFYYALADKTGQVMKFTDSNEPAIATPLFCPKNFIDRQLNLQQSGNFIVCQAPLAKDDSKIAMAAYHINEPLQTQVAWFTALAQGDFDSNDNGVIYTKLTQSVADVMRTISK